MFFVSAPRVRNHRFAFSFKFLMKEYADNNLYLQTTVFSPCLFDTTSVVFQTRLKDLSSGISNFAHLESSTANRAILKKTNISG